MWVFLDIGFFAVGFDKHCQPDELIIKARAKIDLDHLSNEITIGPILDTPTHDYPFRAIIKRSNWAAFLSAVGNGIDYPSLRTTTANNQKQFEDYPRTRLRALSGVWASLKNTFEF